MAQINFNSDRIRNSFNEADNPKEVSKKKSFWKRLVPSTKFLIVIIFIIQVIQFYLLLNPINLFQQLDSVQVINAVNRKVTAPPSELPILARIGDNKTLPDINTLKQQNNINSQVYINAQNGDYVLGYTSKMIIYRRESDQIIYEGLSPVALVNNTQNTLVANLINKAKEQKIIAEDSTQIPQVTIVNEASSFQNIDRVFYENVQKDDLVAVFTNPNTILIYRPSSNTIINSGKVQTNITRS